MGLSYTTMADKSKCKHEGDTNMAEDAYNFRTPGLILGFRGFMFPFGFTYVALFNGLMISDIRILVLHVYCLLNNFKYK